MQPMNTNAKITDTSKVCAATDLPQLCGDQVLDSYKSYRGQTITDVSRFQKGDDIRLCLKVKGRADLIVPIAPSAKLPPHLLWTASDLLWIVGGEVTRRSQGWAGKRLGEWGYYRRRVRSLFDARTKEINHQCTVYYDLPWLLDMTPEQIRQQYREQAPQRLPLARSMRESVKREKGSVRAR